MSSMRSAVLVIAAALAVAAPAATVGAQEEGTRVEEVTATRSGGFLVVDGSATFVDQPKVVGEDPADDATAKGIGAEITRATLSSAPLASRVKFTLEIADQPPQVNGVPVVYYNWSVSVIHSGGTTNEFLLQANRAPGSGLPNTDPVFRILTCTQDPDTGQDTCTESSRVTGTIGDGVVELDVPLLRIGASSGDILRAGRDGVVATLGAGVPAEGDIWFLNFGGDSVSVEDYTLPGATVSLGLAPAGTPPETVVTPNEATVNASTGVFDAALDVGGMGPGTYVLVAKACYGSGNCGLASTDVTL